MLFLKKNYLFIFLMLALSHVSFSQDCEPATKSEDGRLEYFGGKIRDAVAIITDDKSAYSFYIVQINKGKDGNLAYVSFYESVASEEAYYTAVRDFLNVDKLKNSFVEISLNGSQIKILNSSCTMEPQKTMGSIYGYRVNFEGVIQKEEVELLQKHEISKFKITIGGRPFERSFSRSTKITQNLKEQFNCINMDNFFVVEQTEPSQLDLTAVQESDYLSEISGKWLLKSEQGVILEFSDGKITISKMGKVLSEGTFNIVGDKLIYSASNNNNGVSTFALFVKDMIVLNDKGKEYTYERIK